MTINLEQLRFAKAQDWTVPTPEVFDPERVGCSETHSPLDSSSPLIIAPNHLPS